MQVTILRNRKRELKRAQPVALLWVEIASTGGRAVFETVYEQLYPAVVYNESLKESFFATKCDCWYVSQDLNINMNINRSLNSDNQSLLRHSSTMRLSRCFERLSIVRPGTVRPSPGTFCFVFSCEYHQVRNSSHILKARYDCQRVQRVNFQFLQIWSCQNHIDCLRMFFPFFGFSCIEAHHSGD